MEKNEGEKPFVIKDIRQCGKTYYCIETRKGELRECELYVVDEFMREMEDNQ